MNFLVQTRKLRAIVEEDGHLCEKAQEDPPWHVPRDTGLQHHPFEGSESENRLQAGDVQVI